MLPTRFWVSWKIIYEDNRGAVTKRNQKIRLFKEILQVYFFYKFIFWTLYCYCGDKVKHGPLSKHFFQRTQEHGGWKCPQSNDKLLRKILSSSYHEEVKNIHRSKPYQWHTL